MIDKKWLRKIQYRKKLTADAGAWLTIKFFVCAGLVLETVQTWSADGTSMFLVLRGAGIDAGRVLRQIRDKWGCVDIFWLTDRGIICRNICGMSGWNQRTAACMAKCIHFTGLVSGHAVIHKLLVIRVMQAIVGDGKNIVTQSLSGIALMCAVRGKSGNSSRYGQPQYYY